MIAVGNYTGDCNQSVSDCMLISVLSISVEPLEMSSAEAARALKAEYLLNPFLLSLRSCEFVLNPVLPD